MQQLLQSNFHERAGDLACDFAAAQPFRHILVDDFPDPHFCQCLMTEFPAFDERKAINELGVAGRKAPPGGSLVDMQKLEHEGVDEDNAILIER